MRRKWQSEAIAFVADDPDFKRLAEHHGKAMAARIRIAQMMADEAERLGDSDAAARLRSGAA